MGEDDAAMVSFTGGGGVSLAKLMWQMRGSEVVRKVTAVGAFEKAIEEPVSFPVQIINASTGEEREIHFTGKETLQQAYDETYARAKWEGSEFRLESSDEPVASSDEFRAMVGMTHDREQARKHDLLEANLESVRSMLVSKRCELQLRGVPPPPRSAPCGSPSASSPPDTPHTHLAPRPPAHPPDSLARRPRPSQAASRCGSSPATARTTAASEPPYSSC